MITFLRTVNQINMKSNIPQRSNYLPFGIGGFIKNKQGYDNPKYKRPYNRFQFLPSLWRCLIGREKSQEVLDSVLMSFVAFWSVVVSFAIGGGILWLLYMWLSLCLE